MTSKPSTIDPAYLDNSRFDYTRFDVFVPGFDDLKARLEQVSAVDGLDSAVVDACRVDYCRVNVYTGLVCLTRLRKGWRTLNELEFR